MKCSAGSRKIAINTCTYRTPPPTLGTVQRRISPQTNLQLESKQIGHVESLLGLIGSVKWEVR